MKWSLSLVVLTLLTFYIAVVTGCGRKEASATKPPTTTTLSPIKVIIPGHGSTNGTGDEPGTIEETTKASHRLPCTEVESYHCLSGTCFAFMLDTGREIACECPAHLTGERCEEEIIIIIMQSSTETAVISIAVILAILIAVVVVAFYVYRRYKNKRGRDSGRDGNLGELEENEEEMRPMTGSTTMEFRSGDETQNDDEARPMNVENGTVEFSTGNGTDHHNNELTPGKPTSL